MYVVASIPLCDRMWFPTQLSLFVFFCDPKSQFSPYVGMIVVMQNEKARKVYKWPMAQDTHPHMGTT